ncbi:MAG: prepilin-type N-terminal cleavage/methylation domain-containing protein [Nitrospinae bacterium]|nr:prepilin-type N-terminal cleavage/methylation domain-containing protein [Nitrospinota bacterium]
MGDIRGNRGFTTIELIIVIVLMGILAVAVIPKMNVDSTAAPATADLVASDILYTQMAAMSQHVRMSITMTSGSATYNYAVNATTGLGEARNLADIKSTASISVGQVLTFNTLGEPELITAPITITITDGTTTKSLTVQPYTGKVTIL